MARSTSKPDTGKKSGGKSTASPDTAKPDTGGSDDDQAKSTASTAAAEADDKQPAADQEATGAAEPKGNDTSGGDEDQGDLTDDQKQRLSKYHPVSEAARTPETVSEPTPRDPNAPPRCNLPRCSSRPEKRGLCGYHWATRRSYADPA